MLTNACSHRAGSDYRCLAMHVQQNSRWAPVPFDFVCWERAQKSSSFVCFLLLFATFYLVNADVYIIEAFVL